MNAISKRTLAALAACLVLTQPAVAQLPTLGDANDLNVSAERKLGERIARELYRDPDYLDDPVLAEYIQGIWQQLLAAARQRGELTSELDERFAWQVLIGKDKSINAFALPGGWLGLHLGLLSVTTSQDELASVLAHELSHVTQRHIARIMTEQNRQAPLMLAAMILGLLAAHKTPDGANAVIAGSQAMAMQSQLNFSREMEREADRVGFGVLTQAGFEPQGFVTMFEKLQQASRLNDNGNFPYLRTHPLNSERIGEMQARQPLGRTVAPQVPSFEHSIMTARAKVFSYPGVDGLRALITEAQQLDAARVAPTRQAGVFYAAALASSRQRDGAGAGAWLARFTAVARSDAKAARLGRLLEAELALADGNPSRAAELADLAAPARAEMLLGAQARIAIGRAADVSGRLQTWVALNPRDADAWQTLASAYAAQGMTLRSIRAEAEGRVAVLDYAAAVDRYRAAQDMVRRSGAGGDHIEASIIDTRVRAVQSMLREQALER